MAGEYPTGIPALNKVEVEFENQSDPRRRTAAAPPPGRSSPKGRKRSSPRNSEEGQGGKVEGIRTILDENLMEGSRRYSET